MIRKHGWQLPAHTLQVVAITVFCLLVVAFYAFLAPFLGGRRWEYILVAIYSPVAIVVFFLYVRCTAINPADPGIMSKFGPKQMSTRDVKTGSPSKDVHGKSGELGAGGYSSPSSASRSSITATNSKKSSSVGVNLEVHDTQGSQQSCCLCFGQIFCVPFAHEDCRKEVDSEQQGMGEDNLYCTLCNAEVCKFSKHCRSCDKCVDGFDHHCRWLNNCVGRRNYVTFISLMAISLIWLFIEAGVSVAVFVRCFVNKRSLEADIIDRLGNGFTRAPFAAVVAVCATVSLLACVPLSELFFFHIILMKKGLTTYEYVVAMRAMSEAPDGDINEEVPDIIFSPSVSATTAFSGGSSLGQQYKAAWCTPPRVFSDYEDEVVPHLDPGMVPSTVDPDDSGKNKVPRRQIKVSAWKLAKLDSREVMKAAAKARASSSVLRPLETHNLPDPDCSSSGNMSIRSSVSTDMGGNKSSVKNEFKMPSSRNLIAPPSHGSQDEYETGTQSVSSFSSPSHIHESVTLSPLPRTHGLGHLTGPPAIAGLISGQPSTSKAVHNRLDMNCSFPLDIDEKKQRKESSTDPLLLSAPTTSLLRDVKRTSVVWDQEAGRYVSIPATSSEARKLPQQIGVPKVGAEMVSYGRRPAVQPQEISTLTSKSTIQPPDKLTYTGQSIFFGGPLLSVPARDDAKSNSSTTVRLGLEHSMPHLARESKYKRDGASNQLPVFVPGGLSRDQPSSSGLR